MLRKIEYTLSPNGITPHSPQFGGIQGENGATVLEFTPAEETMTVLENLYQSYDSILYRVDCIDGAGQLLVGEAIESPEMPFSFTLTDKHTCMGGRICVTLVISGVNNADTDAVELYSFPAILYFKEFPVRKNYSERHDLNQAVLQIRKMRDETYDIAASALETGEKIEATAAELDANVADALGQIESARDEVTAAAQSAAQSIDESVESAETFAENSAVFAENSKANADTAAEYAGSALTSSVQASGYASDALEYSTSAAVSAKEAQQYAENAAASLNDLLAVTGDINAVLATVVNGIKY